jgi:hypothetical protein
MYVRINSRHCLEESDPVVAMRPPEWPVGMQQAMVAQAMIPHWGTPNPAALAMLPNVYLPGPMRSSLLGLSQPVAGMSQARSVQNSHFHEDRNKWAKKSNAPQQPSEGPVRGLLGYLPATKKKIVKLGVSGW